MLKKIFTTKDDNVITERDKKIEEFGKLAVNWNLEDIRNYLNNRIEGKKVSDEGLCYIIKRFNEKRAQDAKSPSGERREFEPYDRPERTKKGLDIVLSIMSKKELDPETFPLIETFLELYKDVIQALDTTLKQTYAHKLKENYKNANLSALAKSQLKRELHLRYE